MDELLGMIKQTYQELQNLEIAPTKNNIVILNNALNTLENCFTVISKAKVINPEDGNKEEPEDGINVHEQSES